MEQPIREEEVEDAKDEGRAQGGGKEEGGPEGKQPLTLTWKRG